MTRHDNISPGGVAPSHVGGVGLGAGLTVTEVSGPPVKSERAGVPQLHGATGRERAVRAAWNATQATADVEPESLENALVDFGGGFLLAFGKPVVEDWVRERFGVSVDISHETYAQLGVLGMDVLYHWYRRN